MALIVTKVILTVWLLCRLHSGTHLEGKERAQFSSVLTNGRDQALQAHCEDKRSFKLLTLRSLI